MNLPRCFICFFHRWYLLLSLDANSVIQQSWLNVNTSVSDV